LNPVAELPSDTLYYLETPLGVIWIRPQEGGRFWLGMGDDMPAGSYYSPASAAEDVRTKTTGILKWDLCSREVMAPIDLEGWKRVVRRH
jgi:hypothetical protein